ncbi:MAG: PAS domain S-box protein [Anaerolineaceae bacterium]|nr:MAG: PAS domain S-box protein [Anaerolineaceae bacterium]
MMTQPESNQDRRAALVAESDALVTSLAVELVRRYTPTALIAAVTAGEHFDIIVIDLPADADALNLCDTIRGHQRTPILTLLDDDDDDTLKRLSALSATDYVRRPARPAVIGYRLEQIFQLNNMRAQGEYNRHISELATEVAGIGVWDWNMQTDVVYYSAAWLASLGYQPDDIEPHFSAWFERIHPEDRERVRAALDAHIKDGTPYTVEHRVLAKDRTFAWMQARGRVVGRDAEGNPTRMVGIQRNVQKHIELEEAFRKNQERHRIISETISDYAYSYIVNADGTLKKDWSTQAFHDITGYTFQEMDENGWSRLIHPDDHGVAFARFERLLANRLDATEFRIITKSGEVRWLRDHGHPVYDEEQGRVIHIYGAAQDITERKRFEEQLQRQAAELSARNEELDAFAYTVAHDLKNPIASMMGFASLMQSYYTRMSADKVMEYLDLIMESGYKLKDIINALLMLAGVSKMGAVELNELDMQIIVGDTLKRLNGMIEEASATIITPDEWPSAVGYAPWIEEVWANYISNALKYGGQPPRVEIGASTESNGMVRFCVKDNGGGLTPDEQSRVFTPFTRLNQAKIEGHGLGLSIVQRIVHKLGGDVMVHSEGGQGCEFSFTLPAAPPSD